MKINLKIIIVFSIMIIALVLTVGFISFQSLESAVINSEINNMQTDIISKADGANATIPTTKVTIMNSEPISFEFMDPANSKPL